MLIVTPVARTIYLIRYNLASDGNAVDAVTLSNAQLLTDMRKGPLRDLFDISGLTLPQAVARCQTTPRVIFSTISTTPTTAPITAFATAVGIDLAGAPTLTIGSFKLDTPYTGLFDVWFRHSMIA